MYQGAIHFVYKGLIQLRYIQLFLLNKSASYSQFLALLVALGYGSMHCIQTRYTSLEKLPICGTL